MAQIVLHIGFGKTGTSSIQRYLSRCGTDRIGNTRYVYCAFDHKGRVMLGGRIRRTAKINQVGYVSSTTRIPLDEAAVGRLGMELAGLLRQGRIPVFSQEDWGRKGTLFVSMLQTLSLKVRVIAFVRPQVDFFNSGWWQWWYWMDRFKHPEDVIGDGRFGFMRWFMHLDRWRAIPQVEHLDVLLYGRDSVSDFLEVLETPAISSERVNIGLNPLVLKVYNAVPLLRGVHGARMDSLLSRWLSTGEGPPWAVPYELAQRIVEGTRQDNLRLLSLLDMKQREQMEADTRWWSAEPYRNRVAVRGEDLRLSPRDMTTVLRLIIKRHPRIANDRGSIFVR